MAGSEAANGHSKLAVRIRTRFAQRCLPGKFLQPGPLAPRPSSDAADRGELMSFSLHGGSNFRLSVFVLL